MYYEYWHYNGVALNSPCLANPKIFPSSVAAKSFKDGWSNEVEGGEDNERDWSDWDDDAWWR